MPITPQEIYTYKVMPDLCWSASIFCALVAVLYFSDLLVQTSLFYCMIGFCFEWYKTKNKKVTGSCTNFSLVLKSYIIAILLLRGCCIFWLSKHNFSDVYISIFYTMDIYLHQIPHNIIFCLCLSLWRSSVLDIYTETTRTVSHFLYLRIGWQSVLLFLRRGDLFQNTVISWTRSKNSVTLKFAPMHV